MTFMGLTGDALARARIALIVVPAFLLFGFNQSNLGGVLSYPSFTKYYPTIDTATTTGAVQAQNAKLQGGSTASEESRRSIGCCMRCHDD